MIIFDLDGTLADCEHRRHYVDVSKNGDYENRPELYDFKDERSEYIDCWYNKKTGIKDFKPNWKAFYEECKYDTPIQPVIDRWNIQVGLGMMDMQQIWSGRCESVRSQTERWLKENLVCFSTDQLKMRPVGDNTPDDQLKERWLDEAIVNGQTIDYAYDDRPKVVRMWRRRGIFVFDCNQTGREF